VVRIIYRTELPQPDEVPPALRAAAMAALANPLSEPRPGRSLSRHERRRCDRSSTERSEGNRLHTRPGGDSPVEMVAP